MRCALPPPRRYGASPAGASPGPGAPPRSEAAAAARGGEGGTWEPTRLGTGVLPGRKDGRMDGRADTPGQGGQTQLLREKARALRAPTRHPQNRRPPPCFCFLDNWHISPEVPGVGRAPAVTAPPLSDSPRPRKLQPSAKTALRDS